MSNFRRGLMSQQSSSFGGYIRNGLMFQLDCMKECGANEWKDLIGGILLSCTNPFELDNGIPVFKGNNAYVNNERTLGFKREECTIECSFRQTSATNCIIIKSNGNHDVGCTIFSNKIECGFELNTQVPCFEYTKDTLFKTVSFVGGETMYLNKGDAVQSTSTDTWRQFGESIALGGRQQGGTSYAFSGFIFSIRIYNRLLNAEEIRYNQSIDIERFSNL